ncbi:MAG TPA: LuxR C-terminal-related transcriptional regulator [Actinomycetota bacterium]|nr:LuxR C-terminal-related transcriptional regulator [Actinomycetota bacterium]
MGKTTRIGHDDEVKSLITPVELGDGVPQKKQETVALPVGTVTLLLADAEGSTRLWESDPESVAPATRSHDRIVDEAIGRNAGVKPKDQGEGDSFLAAFSRPSDALAAALEIQQTLIAEGSPIRLRMALHTGEVQLRNESNYIGVAINRTARIRAAGHGAQILLSQVTHDLVADRLPMGVTFKDLGVHRLKDLSRPERIFQVLHPDLPHEFPLLRSLDYLPNNLPVQRTSFIGRTRELEELQSLLDATRLLTLSGSGGAGKSRIALQLGAEVLDRFEEGVWFVALAPVQDEEGVAKQTATALGLAETQTGLLPKFIGSKKMLVILDNAEHVLDATGNLSATLLDSCPELRIVVTSRAPLAIEGETTYRVPSLTLPEEDSRVPIESLSEYEAVQLFMDRAAKARPNFKLDAQNAEMVAKICRRLGGIPLALELAAARIRVLSPHQILEGLADRFRLLTGSTRAVMPRQQTLRASVDWSHDLLDETERGVLRRLAVFSAPFDLDAAEVVASSEALPGLQVLDVLTQLVDKSLVVAGEGETTTRYSMLETIREYATERLDDSGEKREVLERHRDHYLRWIQATDDFLYSEWTDPDVDLAETLHVSQWQNAESALEWTLDTGDGATPFRFLASGLWGAHMGAGRDWQRHFERADEIAPEPSVDKARAYGQAGMLSFLYPDWSAWASHAFVGLEMLRSFPEVESGKYLPSALSWAGAVAVYSDRAKARALLEEGVEASDRYGDTYWRADNEVTLGFLRVMQGEVDEGLADLRSSVDAGRRIKNMHLLSYALFSTGLNYYLLGRTEEALPYYEEAIPSMRRYRPEKVWLQWALDHISGILIELDRAGEARAYLEEAIEVSRDYDLEGGNYWHVLLSLARVEELEGSIDQSRTRYSQVAEANKADPWTHSPALSQLGHLESRQGETERAEDLFKQALTEAREIEPRMTLTGRVHPQPILVPVLGFVDLALSTNPARAARLLGFSESWIEKHEIVLPRQRQRLNEKRLETLKDTLGAHRLEAELQGGSALAMEDAVSYALSEDASPVSRALLESDHIEELLRSEPGIDEPVSDEVIEALTTTELSVPHAILTVARAINLVADDPAAAELLMHSVLDTIVSLDAPALSAVSLRLLADVASRQESYEESARLLGAAQALRESPEGEPASWIEVARDGLGTEAFESAREEGKRMSAREAAEYASRGRGKRSRPSAGWQSLTRTEARVAELVAEGLTNPQIAERLFVSKRTVQTHLYNIFTKLDLKNRTELATELVKRRSKA